MMDDGFTLLSALVAGILGGVHCAGMCGGIIGALSMNVSIHNDVDKAVNSQIQSKKFLIVIFYNLGRISSYTMAGFLIGGVGWWLTNWLFINKAQMILQIIAALFMILLGLYLGNWLRLLNKLEKVGNHVWKRIEPFGRRFIPVTRSQDAFLLGIVWGWLPCGLVYSMLIWSMSAGSALQGGLLMLFFGLGTLPNLILIGVFSQQLSKWMQNVWLRSLAGILIISFALVMLYRVLINF